MPPLPWKVSRASSGSTTPKLNDSNPTAAIKWEPRQARTFARVVQDAAHHSGGGVTDPPQTVGDCPDWEDNFILDLVVGVGVGALILVSADTDLTSMSPWRGVPILTPTQFATRVGVMRRHR